MAASRLARDRVALGALGAALLSAVSLAATELWIARSDAPLQWARSLWSILPLLACVGASLACMVVALRRRGITPISLPLLATAATLLALVAVALRVGA